MDDELKAALKTIDELGSALHIAYDWMGRPAKDKYEQAHLDAAIEQAVRALRLRRD
jgi:hypothetical protein